MNSIDSFLSRLSLRYHIHCFIVMSALHPRLLTFTFGETHKERALKLTLVCLRFNPANYTTWWFRRQCLASLSSSKTSPLAPKSDLTYFTPEHIEKDLELASTLGGSNPKNYQVWYHRRSLLEQSFLENSKDADVLTLIEEELEYISSVLEEDSKNYHVSLIYNH